MAIAIGAFIGIGVMAILLVKRQGTPLPTSSPTATPSSDKSPSPTQTDTRQTQMLQIDLDPYSTVVDETLVISGTTTPGNWVTAYTENENYVTQSGQEGDFEIELELTDRGLNTVHISSVDPDAKIAESKSIIVFNTDTEASMFLTGSITDITDSSLQLAKAESVYPEDQKNEIALVAFTDDTDYYNKDEKIDFEDLGIADFVVVLGGLDDTDVMDAVEIVIVSEPTEGKADLLAGNLSVEDEEFVMVNSGEEYTLEPVRSTDYLKYEDGEFNNVSSLDDDEYIALVFGEDLGTIFEPSVVYIIK